ncbi:MAG: LapD/MoxY N-terminal periplasmic domain-containing protein [Paracoccus sp. (in: a-proteobacteria)]
MDASGQIAARIDGAAPGRRLVSLRVIALCGAGLGWLLVFAIVIPVLVTSAREATRNETASALRLASAAATLRLPTSFARRDVMAEAARIAIQINALRHVTAELRDAAGRAVALPPAPHDAETPVEPPEWFAALIRPPPARELIPITQYPNMLGMLEIRTDPRDRIADAWRDLRLILPLLAATALVSVGVTMAVTSLVLRRLRALEGALDRMRAGDLQHRAPPSRIAQLERLGEDVNALAAHLADERAENRRLQTRMMTLAEAERARIASDLHDGIGPELFALHAAIGQAERAATGPAADLPEALPDALADALAAISRHAATIRQRTRAAIDDLRPGPDADAALDEMVQELLIDFAEMAPRTRITLEPVTTPLPDPGEAGRIAIYRFVRESVLNALRHAAPARIEVALRVIDGRLVVRVGDDGTGPAAALPGLGQAGMRDRAAALNGRYLPPRRAGDRTITEFHLP